jgi:hypothetical protein
VKRWTKNEIMWCIGALDMVELTVGSCQGYVNIQALREQVKAVIVRDVTGGIVRRTRWRQELLGDLERDKAAVTDAKHAYARQSAVERLKRREQGIEKYGAEIRAMQRLIVRLENEMPPEVNEWFERRTPRKD